MTFGGVGWFSDAIADAGRVAAGSIASGEAAGRNAAVRAIQAPGDSSGPKKDLVESATGWRKTPAGYVTKDGTTINTSVLYGMGLVVAYLIARKL